MMDIQQGIVAGIAFDSIASTSPNIGHPEDNVRLLPFNSKANTANNLLSANPNNLNGQDQVKYRPEIVNHEQLNNTMVADRSLSAEDITLASASLAIVESNDNTKQSFNANNVVTTSEKEVPFILGERNLHSIIHQTHIPTNIELSQPIHLIKDDVNILTDIPRNPADLDISRYPTNPNIPRYPTDLTHTESKQVLDLRKSSISSGIGGDEAPSSQSSFSSGEYSSCVSVTSLDEDDDEDYLSSIIINSDNQEIRRATSADATTAPFSSTNRSASLDSKYLSDRSERKSYNNTTTIPDDGKSGYQISNSSLRLGCDLTDENHEALIKNGSDRGNIQKYKDSNSFRRSLINLLSNPGYIEYIDEQDSHCATKHNDEEDDDEEYVVEEPINEGGVKFIDDDGDSICSSVDSSDVEKRKSKAPDGGWGWVIVAASFFISCIADGISFSFGLLYIEFLKQFGESSSKTSLIGSLFMSVPLLTGPISSALVDRYGCRVMTIIGGIIAGSGFVVSAFQDSIEMMYLTFGLIAGLGLGLCYVTAVVSIAYWFDKKRTLATGLGACGTGFGTVVYARMTSYFIAEYGWRGTVLLLAGTFFNMCVGGALMRDPEWWTIEQGNKGTSLAGTKSIRAASSCGSLSGFADVEELKRMLKSGETPEYLLTSLATTTAEEGRGEGEDVSRKVNNTYRSVVNLPTFVRQSEKVPFEVLESLSANKRVFNVILENYPSLLLCRSVSDGNKLNSSQDNTATVRVPVTMSMRVTAAINNNNNHTPPMDVAASPISPDMCVTPFLRQRSPSTTEMTTKSPEMSVTPPTKTPPIKHKSILSKAVPRTDSLPAFRKQTLPTQPSAHYLKNIRVHRNSVMYRGAMLNIHRYRLRASSCPDIYRNSMTTIAKENEEKWYADMVDLFRGIVDFSMFLELHFLLMSIATILLFTWFIVPYFYLADHVTQNNYEDDQVSSLLMIIGVTNFIGMVGLGWAGDQPWMNVTKTYAFCLVVCGVATIAMPYFTSSYWLLACACGLFGLFFASSFSFTPVILVQLIPLERFTTAYGLSLMCQGIGSLVGPPLAGLIYDTTRTYDLSFYMAGLWIIVAGILMAIIPMTKNRKIWGDGPIEKDKMSLSDNRDASFA